MLANASDRTVVLVSLGMTSGFAARFSSPAVKLWTIDQADAKLLPWAERNGLRPVSREWRTFRRLPFTFFTVWGQAVFHITIANRTSETRSGYVRLGNVLIGLASDAADVTWD